MRTLEEVESLKQSIESKLDEVDRVSGAVDHAGEFYSYLCNVTETLSWILEEIPTEDFVGPDHMNLEQVASLVRKEPTEELPDVSEFGSLKLPLGEMIRFLGDHAETIDRLRLVFPRMEQLRIVSRGVKQRSALENTITEMQRVREEISHLQSQQRRLAKDMEEIRHRVSLEVFTSVDERGKRKYSNEDMRRAAIHVELASNSHYRELDERAYGFQEQTDALQTEYETLAQTRDIIAVLGVSENSE